MEGCYTFRNRWKNFSDAYLPSRLQRYIVEKELFWLSHYYRTRGFLSDGSYEVFRSDIGNPRIPAQLESYAKNVILYVRRIAALEGGPQTLRQVAANLKGGYSLY